MTTVSSILPASLTGALGLILRDDLGLSETAFGFIAGFFFIGATIGTTYTPGLVDRYGPRSAITGCLSLTMAVGLAIAAVGVNGYMLATALFFGGVANSGNQLAVNKLLSDQVSRKRLASSMSVKQSGMPAGAMIAGFAIPVVALRWGWQWSYLIAATIALATILVVRSVAPTQRRISKAQVVAELSTSKFTLYIMAISGCFASASAGASTTWVTSAAEVAGFTEERSGILLSAGSLLAITARLSSGFLIDRFPGLNPTKIAGLFLACGSVGALILSGQDKGTYLIGVLLAVGIGWSWPALYNYAIVRSNPSAVAKASGITQVGIYVGVLTGPAIMGVLIQSLGYERAWLLPAAAMAIAAMAIIYGGIRIDRESQSILSGAKEN